jgi:hypothetical protein
MAIYGTHPPLRTASDPSDPVWHWFLYNGPHGARFEWHHANHISVPSDINYLRAFIAERSEFDPEFEDKVRRVAIQALAHDEAVVIRTGIQVLVAVGTDEELGLVSPFLDYPDEKVRIDARCGLFERGIKRPVTPRSEMGGNGSCVA